MSTQLIALFHYGLMVTITSASNVAKKVVLQMSSIGLDGILKKFEKPWFLVWAVFISGVIILLFYLFGILIDRILSPPEERMKLPEMKLTVYLQLALPALCDLMSSVLINVALVWISVSVCQMIRSLGVVFTGIFTILLRKRKLFRFQYVGGLIVVLSVTLLGTVEVMNSKNEGKPVNILRIIFGIFLIITGQTLCALESILEEGLLRDSNVTPIFIMGIRSVWGLAIITFFFFPILHFLPFEEGTGLHENLFDSLAMLQNNSSIPLVIVMYAFLSGSGSLSYLLVMDLTSALTTEVISLTRNMLVWMMAVIIHYTIAPSYGEGLGWHSLVELLAFVIMVVGIFVYRNVYKISWLQGDVDSTDNVGDGHTAPTTTGGEEKKKEKERHAGYEEIAGSAASKRVEEGGGGGGKGTSGEEEGERGESEPLLK